MKRFLKSLFFIMMPVVPFAAHGADVKKDEPKKEQYVIIETNMGNITVELFPDRAPETVKNFIGLATGTKEWSGQKKKGQPLYSGTIFHRIISGFMIQGGDPLGRGTGGPGYQFKDEFHSDDKFDKEGILAMANAGPNTNGSQFFITLAPTPHLNGRHTIFGKVTDGLDIVRKIGSVPTDGMDKPKEPVVIKEIRMKDAKEAHGEKSDHKAASTDDAKT